MSLDDLVKGVQTIAVVCNQWGDTGKGKFSDYFASQWADVTARGTGGNNAGHTVVVNGRRKVFHLIPAGIASDSAGKITVLGNGMVIDLGVLGQELDELDAEKNSYNNLMISKDAGVIMPYHVAADKEDKSQKDGGIGTTGRGIGPCYTDKVARRGITIEDLFDKDRLSKKIERAKKAYPKHDINTDDVIDILIPLAERIRPFVRDTVSDCSLNGTASGVGLSAKMIDLPLGIIKFPLMTRVGAGPFPTEIGGADSESYCSKEEHTLIYELITYGIPHQKIGNEIIYDKNDPRILEMINSSSEFIQGVGLRLAAREYGATTGRPRRIGWVDAVAARYAVGINGPLLVLTKPDSLSDAKEFKIAYGYEKEGKTSKTFSKSEKFLRGVTPIYKTYDGYGDISQIKEYDKLPLNLKQAIGDFESFTGGRVAVVSSLMAICHIL